MTFFEYFPTFNEATLGTLRSDSHEGFHPATPPGEAERIERLHRLLSGEPVDRLRASKASTFTPQAAREATERAMGEAEN